MDNDLTTLLNNPAFWILALSNSLILVISFVAFFFTTRSGSRAITQISDANRAVVDSNRLLLNTALAESKASRESLSKIVEELIPVMNSMKTEVNTHNQKADERHKLELETQQAVAKAVQGQTRILEAQLSVMDELSKSDESVNNTIETRIAPSIDAIRDMIQGLKDEFNAIRDDIRKIADKDVSKEITEALDRLTEQIQSLSSLIEKEQENDVPVETEPKSVDPDRVDSSSADVDSGTAASTGGNDSNPSD